MSTTITYKGNTLATVENNTKVLKTAGKYMEGDVTLTDVSRAAPTIQSLSITPSESAQTFNASDVDGYKPVSVSAISSTYVGSGIARKSSTDLTVSGATISAPAGYYTSSASKAVASGSTGTPIATKGTVSNHAVSVTPSVTNTTGYITGGTKTGTAVSVSASELVSGNLAITSNGTGINVANYSTASVSVTPSMREITITPTSETRTYLPNQGVYIGRGSETKYLTKYNYNESIGLPIVLSSGVTYYVCGTYKVIAGLASTVIEEGTIDGNAVLNQSMDSILTLTSGTSGHFRNLRLYNYSSGTGINFTNLTGTSGNFQRIVIDIQVSEALTTNYDGFSKVTVNAATVSIGTKSVTNSSATATSLAFSSLEGEPKAFFIRLAAALSRSSSYSYYYITAIRYNGSTTTGNYWRMSTGNFYNDTSHYSFTYSNGTLTATSSGARGSEGGSFYNGSYELVYVY